MWSTSNCSRPFFNLLFFLSLVTFQVTVSVDQNDPPSSCAEDLQKRKEKLDTFNLTFTDSRQVRLFKYLSARSFNRPVPASVLKQGLDDVPHINKILRQLIPEENIDRKIFDCEKRQLFNRRSMEDCETMALRLRSEYLERFQKLRDLHIDCWNSEGYKFFSDTVTPISQNFFFLQWLASMGSKGTPWKTCNAIFGDEANFTEFTADLSSTYSRIFDDCDHEQWKDLNRYEFICRPQPPQHINTMREPDIWHRIGSRISSLLDLPTMELRPEHRFSIQRTKNLFNSGEYYKPFGGLNTSKLSARKQLMDSYEVITLTTIKLIANETMELQVRALDLLDRYFIEEINMQYDSESRSHHKGIFYIFNKKCENMTLLQLTKIIGSNYPFKYVHVHDGLAYEVNINNDMILGEFIADSNIASHPIIERLRQLLNDFIRFYWDVMAMQGVRAQQPAEEDYAVVCSYQRLSDFRNFDHTAERISADRSSRSMFPMRKLPVHFQRMSKLMNSLIASGGQKPDEELDIKSDEFTRIIHLAYDTFKNARGIVKDQAVAAMEDLLTQIWRFQEEPRVIFVPEFMLNKTFVAECRNQTGCEFLVALKMLGSTYGLTYLNGEGEEVFVDGTGVFTYVPRDALEGFEIGCFRRILNHLADLVLAAREPGKGDFGD